METRLAQELDLREELNELRRMRAVLRSLPRSRSPRNFTLTPEMAGQRQRKPARLYPVMGFASALASLLFVLMVLGDFLGFIPTNLSGNNPAQVQEAAPLAYAPTEIALEAGAQMKSAESVEDAGAAMETEIFETDEALLETPEEEALTLMMEAPPLGVPSDEASDSLERSAAGTDEPSGMGEELVTETPEVPVAVAVNPQASEAPYSILGLEPTATTTATSTPTPMPTETPVWTPIPRSTATSTPTPVPTETPLAALKAVVEEQPQPTSTPEILALAEEPNAADANLDAQPEPALESAEGVFVEGKSPDAPPIPLVQVIQIGFLILAVLTGAAFLILRFKER
ncbi:MAG: hypothetical protein MUC85_01185 [Anaerolineales bacterium]|nr:hypothetical protein [Anaerolineales bacterium]